MVSDKDCTSEIKVDCSIQAWLFFIGQRKLSSPIYFFKEILKNISLYLSSFLLRDNSKGYKKPTSLGTYEYTV